MIRFIGENKDENLASWRLRIKPLYEYLKSEGVNVETTNVPTELVKGDTLIFSKHFDPSHLVVAEAARRGGCKIIFDICDSHWGREFGPYYSAMSALSDCITVPTLFLSTVALEHIGQWRGNKYNANIRVIPDVCTRKRLPPRIGNNFLFYGHQSNLDPLYNFLQKTDFDSSKLTWISNIKGDNPFPKSKFIPWSIEALDEEIEKSNIVLIPQDTTKLHSMSKSSNRVMDALMAGNFVVASPVASYVEYCRWIHIGSIDEGIKWALENPNKLENMITSAQDHIEKNYRVENVAKHWKLLIDTL